MEDLPLLEDPAADETYMQLGFSTLGNAAAPEGGQPAADTPPVDAGDMAAARQRPASCRCGGDGTRNCGTGSGGFQSGNTCGKGGGGGGSSADAGAGADAGGGDTGDAAVAGGGSADAAAGDSSAGPDDAPTPQQTKRKERLRDRIEGTQAEADNEVKKADKKLNELKKKEQQVKEKLAALKDSQPDAQKVFEQGMAKARAEKEAKIAAAKAKYDAKMKAIKQKYGPRDGDGDGILNEGKEK
jgi:hypothetical protein